MAEPVPIMASSHPCCQEPPSTQHPCVVGPGSSHRGPGTLREKLPGQGWSPLSRSSPLQSPFSSWASVSPLGKKVTNRVNTSL